LTTLSGLAPSQAHASGDEDWSLCNCEHLPVAVSPCIGGKDDRAAFREKVRKDLISSESPRPKENSPATAPYVYKEHREGKKAEKSWY
jgi:hypothetical protein